VEREEGLAVPVTQNRLYLYAIVAGRGPLREPLAGLADAPVTLLPYRGIAAAVSQVDASTLQPEPEQLLRHEEVVEALMDERTSLPVRFGTILSGPQPLRNVLAQRYATLSADLKRLAGQVEVGLRVLWDVDARQIDGGIGTTPSGSACATEGASSRGTSYLLARARELAGERLLQERARSLEGWCRQRLGPLATDMVTRTLVTTGLPVSAAFLLPEEKMGALLAGVARLHTERPELDFACTGPWPPYHFVTFAGAQNDND